MKFTIQRDGTITDVDSREAERLRRRSTSPRSARCSVTQTAAAAAGRSILNPTLTVHLNFEYTMMTQTILARIAGRGACSSRLAARAAATAAAAARDRSSRARSSTTISGEAGAPPRLAVPDFIALSTDAETVAIAQDDRPGAVGRSELRARVLRYPARHLRHRFRRRRRSTTCRSIAGASSAPTASSSAPCRRRRRRQVEVRLFNVRTRQSVFGEGIHGAARPTRGCTRTRSSDEIHQQQRALRGVARTKLTFASDRDGERMTGTVENRERQGDLHRRLRRREPAAGHRQPDAEHHAAWSPDGRSIAYTSYRRGHAEHLHLEHLPGHARGARPRATGRELAAGVVARRHADRLHARRATATPRSTSSNRDGSNVRRLTNNPAIDTTPTWSPTGTQIAFTSDRTGTPQIYVDRRRRPGPAAASRSESYCGSADLVAGAVQRDRVRRAHRARATTSRSIDLATRPDRGRSRSARARTRARRSRRTAATSRSRRRASGKTQIFTIARDGKDLRQITQIGNNYTPGLVANERDGDARR